MWDPLAYTAFVVVVFGIAWRLGRHWACPRVFRRHRARCVAPSHPDSRPTVVLTDDGRDVLARIHNRQDPA